MRIKPDSNFAGVLRQHFHEEAGRIMACVNGCADIVDPAAVPDLVHACRLLVGAYERAEDDGASIDWEDIDAAHALALEALETAERTSS